MTTARDEAARAEAPRSTSSRTHSLRAVAGLARVSFLHELQYRANFWMYVVNSVLELGLSLLTLSIVFGHVDEVNGWSHDDLLVVVGSFFILHVVVQGIVHPSVSRLVQDVRTGNFDHRLLKPVDAQLVSVVQSIDGWRVMSLLLGLGLTVGGLAAQGVTPTVPQVAAWMGMVVCGSAIAGCYWSLVSSITFWTIQGEGILWTLDDMYEYVRWPVTIFPTPVRVALSSVYPLGLAVTVPAEALLGRLSWGSALLSVGLTVGFACAARVTWHRAIRRYEGASG